MQFLKKSPLSLFLAFSFGLSSLSQPLLGSEASPRLGDGSVLRLDTTQISITPPVGWEVLENKRGKALIMQVPVSKEPIKDYSKPLYSRNVTLAVTHESLPIDETQAQALRAKLEKDFGSAPGVSNFQIVEHRFIDYRNKADAILVYTAFDYNGFPMSQMHIMVSGSINSALLSYTDLAEEFQKNEAAMNQAWNSMLSIEMVGLAPKRYAELIPAAAGLLLSLTAAITWLLMRRRKAKRFIDAAEDKLYCDDPAPSRRSVTAESFVSSVSTPAHTVSEVWALQKKARTSSSSKSRRKASTSSSISQLSVPY